MPSDSRRFTNINLQIRKYLDLRSFDDAERQELEVFLLRQCSRLEQTAILRVEAKQFLRDRRILEPATWTLDRIIGEQRRKAREQIFFRISDSLVEELRIRLDALLEVGNGRPSGVQRLKEVPGVPSAGAMLRLTDKLDEIKATGVLDLDLSWLNNNYQRALAKHARKRSAHRLRELDPAHRYASLVCFLSQTYQDTIDFIIDMQDKLLTRICSRAQREVDETLARKRNSVQRSAAMLQKLGSIVLNEEVPDAEVRKTIYERISKGELSAQIEQAAEFLGAKTGHEFERVVRRFTYLRRFTPFMLQHLAFQTQAHTERNAVLDAVQVLIAANNSKGSQAASGPADRICSKQAQALCRLRSSGKHGSVPYCWWSEMKSKQATFLSRTVNDLANSTDSSYPPVSGGTVARSSSVETAYPKNRPRHWSISGSG